MIQSATEQSKNKSWTNIFLRKGYSREALLDIIDVLIDRKVLRRSDHLIWDAVMEDMKHQEQLTVNGKMGVIVDIYKVMDSLKGDINPDFTTGRVINYSRQAKSLKFKKYRQIGMLTDVENEHVNFEAGYPTSTENIKYRSPSYAKKSKKNWPVNIYRIR